MSTLFQDSFTRANSAAGGVGNGTTDPDSNWKILNNQLVATADFVNLSTGILRLPGTTAAEQQVTAIMGLGAGPRSNILWLRESSNSGYIAFALDGNLDFVPVNAGVSGSAVTVAFAGTAPNLYRFRAAMVGSKYKVWVADATKPHKVIAYLFGTDATYASGGAALTPFVSGCASDDVVVEDAVSCFTPNWITWDGDSMGAGTTLPSAATQSYPAIVAAALGDDWTSTNFCVSGQTIAQMNADRATQIEPIYDTPMPNGLVVVQAGVNSINPGLGDLSGAAAFAQLVTYADAMRAKQAKPMGGTMLETSIFDATARRAEFNALMRADHGAHFDYVMDWGDDAAINADIAANDGIHPYITGHALMAAYVQRGVAALTRGYQRLGLGIGIGL